MKRAMIMITTVALLMFPTGAVFAQDDPKAVVTALIGAMNDRYSDVAMTLISDSATITNSVGQQFGESSQTYATTDQIRKRFVESSPGDFQIVSIVSSGNTVHTILGSVGMAGGSADGDGHAVLGVHQFDLDFVAVVENGKIQSATLDLTAQTKAAIQAGMTNLGGAAGGMPRTGDGDQFATLSGLALVAMLLGGVGMFLVRRRI